ncbi:hypothetical protein BATDEDRAFT_23196 [Batrachochytrium dendrobatidis JAM81]|uniref:Uncharacterized protein n=1 Tax=Batrachochytrium dendrobatidis (strain JAM81 / FGSC 10211) TaxID=684364 RepID=F4NX09_BATDJ|nr:uncharacterized protein BATDEDRAFT_23196 [Batrachochytrium dendrobatidis JAM81]EGF82587.1 hypothetical protein BATDEDRAFT_23196 [Batrachochytrium dendrobatidis JAM81]|eukprot:XP_006676726.1 hypothetical protein BATDEDRAFT_23196 [Batrachochytrium dendrobatidis JAM81]
MSPVGSHVIKLAEGLHVPRLERANYQKWLVLIEAALRHFNLWESHIIAKPPSKPDQPYLINNAKAYSMISATLSKDNEKLAEDLNGIPLSAHLSFAAIKKHHETGNMSAKLELEDELDLIVYDTQVGVKQLYDEMFDIRKLLSQIGVKWSDEDYVRKLLRKLLKGSSHWGNMRTRFDSFTKSNYATADIRTMLAYEEQQLITVMLLPSLDNAEVALSGIKKPKANIKVVAESTQFISNEAINASSPRIQELSQPDSEVEDTPLKSKTQGPYYYYKRQPDVDYMNSSLFSASTTTSIFPSNWKQAMTAPDANLWKIAADKETESRAPLFTHSYNLGDDFTPSVPIVIDNVVSPETPEIPEIPYRASTLTGGESKSGRRQVPIVVQTARNTARMTVADRGTNIKTSHGRITQEGLLGRAISKNKAIKTSLNKSSLAGYRKPNRKSRSKSQGSRKEVQERPVDVMNRDRAMMAAPIKSTPLLHSSTSTCSVDLMFGVDVVLIFQQH